MLRPTTLIHNYEYKPATHKHTALSIRSQYPVLRFLRFLDTRSIPVARCRFVAKANSHPSSGIRSLYRDTDRSFVGSSAISSFERTCNVATAPSERDPPARRKEKKESCTEVGKGKRVLVARRRCEQRITVLVYRGLLVRIAINARRVEKRFSRERQL